MISSASSIGQLASYQASYLDRATLYFRDATPGIYYGGILNWLHLRRNAPRIGSRALDDFHRAFRIKKFIDDVIYLLREFTPIQEDLMPTKFILRQSRLFFIAGNFRKTYALSFDGPHTGAAVRATGD